MLLPYYKCEAESGYFTFSLLFEMDVSSSYIPSDYIFHLHTMDLLHSDTAMLQILSLHVIFQLHFLPGLMPFLNCFKVWLGNVTHSLKQYM